MFASPLPGGGISVELSETHRPLLATCVEHPSWEAHATDDAGTGRLVLRLDDAHWVAVESKGDTVSVGVVIGPVEQVLGSANVPAAAGSVVLAIRSTPETTGPFPIATVADILELGYLDGDTLTTLASIDGR